MEDLVKNKLNLVRFRDIIKLTAYKNGVSSNSPSFVSDVLIRALHILAFNTRDAEVVRNCCLHCNYISEKNKYIITEQETKYIETMQPFYSVDKKLKEIDKLIRDCRINAHNSDNEEEAQEIRKTLKFYNKIHTYLLCVGGELNTLNKAIKMYEYKKAEIEKEEKLIEERKKLEENGKKPPVPLTKEVKEQINKDEKLLKLKQELKDGTFEIWCPKCRTKVIPRSLKLTTSTTKKGVKQKRLNGNCPVHNTQHISVVVPHAIGLDDLLSGSQK